MQAANNLTMALQPMAVTAAEDSQDWPSITEPISDKSAGYPGAPGGGGFVSQWGYKVRKLSACERYRCACTSRIRCRCYVQGFFYSFYTYLTEANNRDVDMSTVASLASSSAEGTRVLFTENHDMVWERVCEC